ncbi:PREDICTED: cyclin-D3-3-like [Tarenaya hassleriana]|uniref:cyclin-D3-3-like n=1 Tax=Tarenaya hassleriana TaxID=28532 RepID=UPI00053C8184|nr:PREDICTED: cyclin-D3-3-like [Tarenaya hassleriana]
MARFVSDVQESTQQDKTQEPQLKPPLFCRDSLYCCEESWEELGEHEEESFSVVNGGDDDLFPVSVGQDLLWCEDEELSALLSKEELKTLEPDPCLNQARIEAVDWILRVVSHYSFSALTALLAVNYFDRFFSDIHFQAEKPWMSQLTAVACLSLAAKVEEVDVPLLLDIQVEESKYMFEAKAIHKMEILVLSALQWRMHPVTALSFLDYFIMRLGLKDFLSSELARRCELVLISVISDSRFLLYLPSVMATATMLHVISSFAPSLTELYRNQLKGMAKIDMEKVDKCLELMKEAAPASRHGNQTNKRKFGLIASPSSPNTVMEGSFGTEGSSNDSGDVSSSSSVASSPEQVSKKSKGELGVRI